MADHPTPVGGAAADAPVRPRVAPGDPGDVPAGSLAVPSPAGPGADGDPPPLGELIGRVARAIHFQSRQLLAPLGLTPAAARALRALGHPDRPMRMVDLAERMHVVPRTVTTLVDALEADELVERRQDPNDRRSTLVHLTDRGRARLDDMLEARRTAAGELLSALSADEQLQMRRLLSKLDLEGSRPPRC